MEYRKKRAAKESAAQMLCTVCVAVALLAVSAITVYMLKSGIPAIRQIGLGNILLGTQWNPAADDPQFGILYVILTSVVGTLLGASAGIPLGILTAVYLAEESGHKRGMTGLVKGAVELLAGIPSVIYGLLGIYLLNPWMYRLELRLFSNSETHRFTGGANLLSAAIVLAVMMLPTIINISEASIRAVKPSVREASLALGASRIQTCFLAVLPAAGPGIATAVVLGVGRAMGEAMAITLVSGGSVNAPLPFRSVRFLTTAIVGEMGYAHGLHRQVLFTIGLVLFGFIMLMNLWLTRILKESRTFDG
ncbi:MAG: phosphate ABC transporter permease subunit PstC [Lachnospiraceae bacterium]|nr:phosphate ABC transporter permease subunit PstC [Lachnospiraceae bacterium]